MNNRGKETRKHKSIRSLEKNAKNGSLKAMFQLAKYYEQGKYVEKNQNIANTFYEKSLKIFKTQSFLVSSVKLINFRAFEYIEIDFCTKSMNDSNLTVIIGSNGVGKTALCKSIAKCLSWVIRRIVSQSGNGGFIERLDINNNSAAEYASIITTFLVTKDAQYEIELSKAKEGSNSSRKNQLLNIGQLADIYKYANSKDDQLNFPIMAFYSVERALDINTKDIGDFIEIIGHEYLDKFDGYNKSLNGTADFKLFFHWFKYLDGIDNVTDNYKQELRTAIDKLQAELDSDLINKLEEQADSNDKISEYLDSFKKENQSKIERLRAEMDGEQQSKHSKIIKCVIYAINKFMPEFSNLRIQRTPHLDMLVDKCDITLSVLQLSQGEKSLIALIADIVRRLVLLNPSLKNPLEGNGVVLIDEIDLHLHPEWQQSVLPNLLATFPNIQFIVTTHSPQVLTTVDAKCIRIFKNGKIYSAPKGSKGAESSRILQRVFEVDARPPNDPNTLALAEYKILVYNDDWRCERAIKLRKILDEQFDDEEPDLTELDLYIENRIWEIDFEKNQ